MKKIIAIAALALFMVACKKENKTISKVDPTTGKTITVEVDADEAEKVQKEMAEKAAIKDSLGIYKQFIKLEKGKTYPFTTYQKNIVTMSASGKKQSATSESTDEVTFTVNGIDKDVYDISINFLAKKTSQTIEGKTYIVDTQSAAPKEEQLKNKWNIDKTLTGNTLNMKMNTQGKILSISGFEPVYQKVNKTLASLTKDPQIQKGFQQEIKSSFNEEILKDQFTKNIMVLPKKGAKIGEQWNTAENASPDGKVKINTNYKLVAVKDGVAEISISGGIPKQSQKDSQSGVTRIASSELNQNGTMKFDVNSGWILNQNINVKTIQKQTYTDGKQTQSMENVTNSSVIVNPTKK